MDIIGEYTAGTNYKTNKPIRSIQLPPNLYVVVYENTSKTSKDVIMTSNLNLLWKNVTIFDVLTR